MATILLLLLFSIAAATSDDIAALLEFKKPISDPTDLLSSWSPSTSPSNFSYISVDPTTGGVTAISLAGLSLSGEIKLTTLTGMASLQNLTLAGNYFSGRIPPVMGSMTSLRYLDLSSNRFYGPVPPRLLDVTGLTYLNLSSNNFSSTFPSTNCSNLQNLRVLDLNSNNFQGDVFTLLSSLRNVEYIDVSNNGFYGNIDFSGPEVDNVTTLGSTARYLNLTGNRLGGGFFSEEGVGVFRNLEVVDLSGTGLSGELPRLDEWFGLVVFKVGANRLFGDVPEALFQSSMRVLELDLSGNGFSGSLPDINSTTLKILNLSSNALTGPLPSSFGTCISVDLSRNMLSGDLSVMRSWDERLEVLDLSSNGLSGSYPNDASQFQNLISLKIRNNSLSGTLPSILGSYQNLSVLDLSLNELTGSILPTFFTSPTLTVLNLSGNNFNGTLPLSSSKSTESLVLPSYPPHLEILDLSTNSLSGPLPPEIGNMQSLTFLILRNNDLSGELPSELSKLDQLEYIDLSNNHFTGGIPDMPQSGLTVFNVSYNDLSGTVPKSVERFPASSFHPGNTLLVFPDGLPANDGNVGVASSPSHHHANVGLRIALIIGCIGAAMLVVLAILALVRSPKICGNHGGQITVRDIKFSRPNLFKSPKGDAIPTSKTSFSNDHLLTSEARSMSGQKVPFPEASDYGCTDAKGAEESAVPNVVEHITPEPELPASPHVVDPRFSDQAVTFEVYSPDRLAGDLIFLDNSVLFTAEDLSRAPAEVLGRSSHGTTYKATLHNGHMLTVKWLRVGLVKHKKEFAKEVKKIGTINHPNIIPWRACYWGPKEQERLIISDYVSGDSLALYLYESTPRRYSRLSVGQRLKIAVDLACCLSFLHNEKGLPHGNLKPTNVFLTGSDLTAKLADYGLHRLMMPSATAEQILNLGALGYRAPEIANASKAIPSFKADVYAFGVIMMEMLTRKSAGDIISGQANAVDLTDWVQMCNREGRGTDCFDRDIAGLEEAPRAMDELLAISLRCILPVNERPNIKTVCEDLCSITM